MAIFKSILLTTPTNISFLIELHHHRLMLAGGGRLYNRNTFTPNLQNHMEMSCNLAMANTVTFTPRPMLTL